ncbi:XRE family transcriptional regulator [Amycolatopsis pigmentata]|uniref:XRE family transcriptional regulator n=1 Tax=Amycolatopsis pigmentata TaxID=450801 RepID=A0ABW5G5E5_9PSEU
MWRKEIKHPKLYAITGARALDDAARKLAEGDVSVLTYGASGHWSDVALGKRVSPVAAANLRIWVTDGRTSTVRANALSILAKQADRESIDLVIRVLGDDEKVRLLCLTSVVSRMLQVDWETGQQIALDPASAPSPRRLAKAMASEAVNPRDVESRWCGARLLQELVPVLSR